MSNWYQNENWYAPLQPAPAPAPAPEPKKKKRSWPWVLGILLLSLAIVVGLSLALRDTDPEPAGLPEFSLPHSAQREDKPEREPSAPKEEKPGFREFFDELYPKEETQRSTVNIPRSETAIDFRLSLQPAEESELSLKQLYERCMPSVVGISGYINGKIGYNWGSGVILTEDGLILTNTHVIEGCDSAKVTLFDDREFEAKLVGADSISDIALLKIDARHLPAADFGDSSTLTVGQQVAAIGNPLGEQFRMTLTDGIISAISRDINYNGRTMTLMQTNAALNEGNSGGPLFNMHGQVIGITNMKMMSSESSIEGIGFAIPTSTVLTVVNGILQDGKVVGRVSIGITIGPIPDSAIADYDLPEGLYIVTVEPSSDAAKKGLQEGDILMEVNGQKVTTTAEVSEIKDRFSVGDELLFKIWRDGEILEVSVALVDTNDVYG